MSWRRKPDVTIEVAGCNVDPRTPEVVRWFSDNVDMVISPGGLRCIGKTYIMEPKELGIVLKKMANAGLQPDTLAIVISSYRVRPHTRRAKKFLLKEVVFQDRPRETYIVEDELIDQWIEAMREAGLTVTVEQLSIPILYSCGDRISYG
jgi:hypothetical protein